MILGPVSYLDCIVFCIFLAPQLILNVGLFETVVTVLQVLPFLGTKPTETKPLSAQNQLTRDEINTQSLSCL